MCFKEGFIELVHAAFCAAKQKFKKTLGLKQRVYGLSPKSTHFFVEEESPQTWLQITLF